MKLFVARLPQSATSASLKSLFETIGGVTDAKVIMDRETGLSKCYGFIEMTSAEAAEHAISKLNGFELDGKEIMVKPSEPSPKAQEEKKPFFRPAEDRHEARGRDDRKKHTNRYEDRDDDDGWERKKNLRPRRKRI